MSSRVITDLVNEASDRRTPHSRCLEIREELKRIRRLQKHESKGNGKAEREIILHYNDPWFICD